MRALVLHAPGRVALEEVPSPRPGAGEVLLRMEAALLGGTVRKLVARGGHARLGGPPLRLGHEGAGVVLSVGDGVESFSPGELVVPANSAPCGLCESCRRGATSQCTRTTWLTGCLADELLVPATIVEKNLHRVPPGLAPETAALAENLACVLKGLDHTPPRAGERVLVLGGGPMGVLWVRALSSAGARVTLVGRNPLSEPLGRRAGAQRFVSAGSLEAGERFDLVVEVVGTAESWQHSLAAVAPGGRVHFFGGPPPGTRLPIDAERLHYEELTLTASFHHTPAHFAKALALLADGFVEPDLLLEDPMGLADVAAWLARPRRAPRKGVVRFDALPPA